MTQIKRIEMKNLDLILKQDNNYFYVYLGEHKGMTTKNLATALHYFDVVFEEYLRNNN